MNKNIKAALIKKLTYQSSRRGYKELQIILSSFAKQYLEGMDVEGLKNFATILEQSDCNIYDWLINKTPIPYNLRSNLMDKLLSFILINKQ